MKIIYNKHAIEDIQNTQKYIIDYFHDETSAKKITSKILDAVSVLSDNPRMGTRFIDTFDVETNMRFLIIQKHMVFYEIFDEKIEIFRIFDSRQVSLSILF